MSAAPSVTAGARDWSAGAEWGRDGRGTVGALSAAAILADRSSPLSPSAADVTPSSWAVAEAEREAYLAPLLVNAEKSRRAIVRVARTEEPAKREEEEAADEGEKEENENEERYRKSSAADQV